MTKKDYVLIANILKTEYQGRGEVNTILRIALNLSKALKLDNYRFNENRFLEACGINNIKVG